MADVWHATDQKGEAYALKKMHESLRYNFWAKRGFLRGCKILSRIHNHDYVIGYEEHGKIRGAPYLLMEYVENSNLKEVYNRRDPVLQEFLGNIFIDMAIALEHVHDSGFMHLDFKPENVLVTRNGNIRLVDFDLARLRPSKPKKYWKNPGTPPYMAPEVIRKQPMDHRADIFSYGVVAYEMLTYRKPFPGESAEEVLRAQLERNLAPPTQHNPEIHLALEKIVMRCLEVDPDKRYPDMSMLVHALEAVLYV
ncbi:MAG: serine/threonine protein kinase [Pedosphaera parvula]|nr:serine/threonine protein kinase [Pedosphaera parvula]